ncbi:hypothetical protein J2W24_004629 [Variovorax boronicumulans]|nr:hypothetical protein [Variovorax boronicumulans]
MQADTERTKTAAAVNDPQGLWALIAINAPIFISL